VALSDEEKNEFNTEAFELLDNAEKGLLAMDEGAEISAHYDSIFRTFHNIKGASGMMELLDLQSHMHQLESIFTQFKGQTRLPKEQIDLFLRGIDATRLLLKGESIQFSYQASVSGSNEVEQHQAEIQIAVPIEAKVEPLLETQSEIRVESKNEVKSEMEASYLDFASECEEILLRVSQYLNLIESSGTRPEVIDAVYRDIHSIKGSSYLMGFKQMGDVGHAMESCLEPYRQNQTDLKGPVFDALYQGVDLLERMFHSIQKKSQEDFSNDLNQLIQLLTAPASPVLGEIVNTSKPAEVAPVSQIQTSNSSQAPSSPQLSTSTPTPIAAPTPSPAAAAANTAGAHDQPQDSNSTIRVPVALLDKLMTLVGEMVLVRNQVTQYSSKSDDLEFLNLSQRLNVVTGEIQGEMMKTRMQPIGNILTKFQRVVRDLSKELKKKIDLTLHGAETELDKTLLEAVKDPLTHIVRNSCDHGIETPEDRRAKGKSDNGTITIRSFHEGGQVIVEVTDDGRGLHRDKLIAKAVEKGLITSEKSVTMSDREVMNLIFAPGFSTAAAVTNVSGRGVGMDVVKSNIDRIGGTVELESVQDKGSTIRLKIPLTLAIVPTMIARCGEERYAIPQIKLVELVRVGNGSSDIKIEFLQGKPVLRLRGNLLPLLDLKGILGFEGHDSKKYTDSADAINVIVLNSERTYFGLIVDEIQDTADIVVKPLSRFLKTLAIYSGATVLGDGSVALILDIAGMAERHLNPGGSKDSSVRKDISGSKKSSKSEDAQEFLLFRLNSPTKHSIFLGYVHRLEEFKRDMIEMSGNQRVVRYRNHVLPLISLNQILEYPETPKDKESSQDIFPVIVTQRGDNFYGIEVNEIIDVLTTEDTLDNSLSDRPAILGNIVTDSEVIVVIDPHQCIPKKKEASNLRVVNRLEHSASGEGDAFSGLNQVTRQSLTSLNSTTSENQLHILLVEDTAFFRKHVTGMLVRAGYRVTSAKDGEEGLAELEKHPVNYFQLVLSDIEMPKMNGYELASAIRKDAKWNTIPLVALTTKSTQKDRDHGLRMGFNLYLEKLNSDELLTSIDDLVRDTRASATALTKTAKG
jgi:two-component system chemotaxis sensor kinase CheA